MSNDDKSVDLLGLKPVAEAAKIVTDGTVKGAGAFLSRICLPAAEEFGFLLRDRVGAWRANNALKIVAKAEKYNSARENGDRLHAHPRMVMMAIEEGSWADSDDIQSMWSGLLSSSCTVEGEDDDNLVFMNILKQLTTVQAKVINYSVERCNRYHAKDQFVVCDATTMTADEAMEAFDCRDVHTLDYQMDYLREVGLFGSPGGFMVTTRNVVLSPTPLAVSFYVRCQGFVGAPNKYFENLIEYDGRYLGVPLDKISE